MSSDDLEGLFSGAPSEHESVLGTYLQASATVIAPLHGRSSLRFLRRAGAHAAAAVHAVIVPAEPEHAPSRRQRSQRSEGAQELAPRPVHEQRSRHDRGEGNGRRESPSQAEERERVVLGIEGGQSARL